MSRAQTWLVVPCYNEAARLDGPALLAFVVARPDVGLLLVDDGSTDDTLAVLRGLAAAGPPGQVEVLALPVNSGKGEAVRQGLLALSRRGEAAVVGFWDADLSTPLSEVDHLLAALQGDPRCEIVMASRVRLLGRTIERSVVRHYGGRAIATLISLALDLPVYDTQCGAKLLRVTPGLGRLLAEPFMSRWLFDVELLARWLQHNPGDAWLHGLREVPLAAWQHAEGSKISPLDGLRAPAEVLRIGLWHRRRLG